MNIAKILTIIIAIVIIGVAAWYIMGQFEQTKPIAETITNTGTQIISDIQANPGVSAVAGAVSGGGLLAVGAGALSKINTVKNTASETVATAKNQVTSLTQQKDAAEGQISNLQNTLSDKDALLQEMTQRCAEAEAETANGGQLLTSLKTENEGLKLSCDSLQEKLKKQMEELGALKAKMEQTVK